MKYFTVFMLALILSACGSKLPEGVDHPCPAGTKLQLMEDGGYIEKGAIRATCVIDGKDGIGRVAGLEAVYSKSGKVLFKADYNRNGDPVGERVYWKHSDHSLHWWKGLCGGDRVKLRNGLVMKFNMPCKKGQKKQTAFCFGDKLLPSSK